MSESRPVRITIEGRARENTYDRRWLAVHLDSVAWGCLSIPKDDPNVSVEWLPESRDWRDGDVVQTPHNQRTLTRLKGRWLWCGTSNESATDSYVNGRIADGVYVILRYQAGEADQ